MLTVGDRAPEFTLPDDGGTDRSLTDFLRSGAILLYFYSADFSAACTRHACALRDLKDELQQAGLRVVGISPQPPASHAKFRRKYALPFALLSDEHKAVARMYGLIGPFGFGLRRSTLLVDPDRRVRAALTSVGRVAAHAQFVRKAATIHALSR